MYIRENLNYKRRGDLENLMYKPEELESVFYEVNSGKKGEIYGCIYKHPCLEHSLFHQKVPETDFGLGPSFFKTSYCTFHSA